MKHSGRGWNRSEQIQAIPKRQKHQDFMMESTREKKHDTQVWDMANIWMVELSTELGTTGKGTALGGGCTC